MSTQCESNTCCTKPGDCAEQRPCGAPADQCPIDCAAGMWNESFVQAMRQAQVEILKEKIKKAWGPLLDQSADAALESMGACWQSMIAEVRAAQAKETFKSKLRDLWLTAKK